MSTIEVPQTEPLEQEPERKVAVRRYEVEIEAGKGRTVSLRIAPFGEIAQSADGLGGLPRGQVYQEELMPGLYDKQLRAANRVLLNFEHQEGIGGIIGHGLALRSASDGYHGDFRIQETPAGDTALDLVRNGVLTGASVESWWIKSVRSATGVVQRVKAHLDAVALCRQGAYPGAVVTGLRQPDEPEGVIMDAELLPVPLDPDVLERCKALGIKIPQRMAHPAQTDTPDLSGTSDAAPASGDNHDSEE